MIKISKILIEARQMIEAGRHGCICYCFQELHRSKKIDYATSDMLQDWIIEQIQPHIYFNSWVRANHPAFYDKIEMDGIRKFREGRLAWLDYLIARQIKHEKKGKK